MVGETVTLVNWLLALSPIVVVLVLMVGLGWGGAKAGPAGWLVAFGVALLFFGANPLLLAYSQARAVLLTLYVLYIIWMALVLYNIVQESGAISVIAQSIVNLTGNRVLQLLILSWVFSAFLQGVAGFGVPIAVVAPLLIGLGFSPVTAVAAVAVGHSWSVTFGDIASSFNALIAATGLSGEFLAPWSAILLGISCFACGMAAAHCHEGFKSVRQGLPIIGLVGGVMALTQYGLAVSGLWNLAGFMAGLAGLGAGALLARFVYHGRGSVPVAPLPAGAPAAAVNPAGQKPGTMPFLVAIAPYLMLILIVTIAELVPSINDALSAVNLNMTFPATQTGLGWVTEAGKGRSISVFGHAGALLFYTSIIAYVLFASTGYIKPTAWRRILSKTTRSAVSSSIGIATMVGFALIMEQSGMTNLLAVGMSKVVQPVYPLLSPFIGLLGAFMTGSNTNSNVVFAGLQQETAGLLALPIAIILAAQTTGGSLGSMLAPAKIIVGCSTAGLAGQEGKVLRYTIVYGIVITIVIGSVTWLATR